MQSSPSTSPTLVSSQPDIERRLEGGELSDWATAAYGELRDKVADEAFPCTFGTIALAKREILFSFLETTDEAELLDGLVRALAEYAAIVQSLPMVKASMQPLAIFMPPPPDWRTMEDYYRESWRILGEVHARDPQPWPERIPTDPDSPEWSFCFAGVPFFVNFKTPLYDARRSRLVRQSYLWLVQARDGFDVVAGDTTQGRNARAIIREKLAAYDAVPMYPELAHYGHPNNREWKQYFVPETNEPLSTKCPFHRPRGMDSTS